MALTNLAMDLHMQQWYTAAVSLYRVLCRGRVNAESSQHAPGGLDGLQLIGSGLNEVLRTAMGRSEPFGTTVYRNYRLGTPHAGARPPRCAV